jgi:predicted RNA binding protein YcfA (HicA-like mRNA interferase family)
MPNKLFNWTFKDVESFLKERGFHLNYTNASHYYYAALYNGKLRNVCVPFHGNNKTIKPRTLRGIILQSGIPQKDWIGE